MRRLAEAQAVVLCWGLALAIVFLVASCGVVHASSIKDEDAIKAIIGEVSGERVNGSPLIPMQCVASAIRNRGTLRGVYGLKAPHVSKQPAWVWKLAKIAWEDSAEHDYAEGATHWEGTVFKKPYWTKDMVLVKRVANTNYYKERNK